MDYQVFKQEMEQAVRRILPAQMSVELHRTVKNNGTEHDELCIRKTEADIAPLIYLGTLYDRHLQGETVDVLAEEVARVACGDSVKWDMDLSILTDYALLCEGIVFRLISRERNRELLKNVPYRPYLDLAIVYYCIVGKDGTGTATFLIKNEQLGMWAVDEEELYHRAMENTPKLFPQTLLRLDEVLRTLMPEDKEEIEDIPLRILTNRDRTYGAGCLLYPGVLEECAKCLDSGFFILPSSVHETLLLPCMKDEDRRALEEMVRSVNSTAVREEEILSDHAYYYDRDAGALLTEKAAA